MPGIIDQIDPRTQGLMAGAFQGMQAAGPRFGPPASLGQIIGQMGQAGMGQYNQAQQQQQDMAIRQQQLEMTRMAREQQAMQMKQKVEEQQRQAEISARIKQKIKPGMDQDEIMVSILPEIFEMDPLKGAQALSTIEQKKRELEFRISDAAQKSADRKESKEFNEFWKQKEFEATERHRKVTEGLSAFNAQTGRMNATKDSAGGGAKPPSGYRWKEGEPGVLEAIPGGPATVQSTEQAAKTALITTGIQDVERFKKLVIPNGEVNKTIIRQMVIPGGMPNTDSRKAYSYIYNAIEAKLRAESGAAVPETEVTRMARRFVPSVWDNDSTVKDKVDRLDEFLKGTIPLTKGSAGDAARAAAKDNDPLGIR